MTAPLEALDTALSRALDADAAWEAAEVACERPDCAAIAGRSARSTFPSRSTDSRPPGRRAASAPTAR